MTAANNGLTIETTDYVPRELLELCELAELTKQLGPWNAAVAMWQTDPALLGIDPLITVSVAPQPVVCSVSGLRGFMQRVFVRRDVASTADAECAP
ncbi:MAG: hypothetical protein JWM93_3999 [Frankiales bacterium]|nr:hypothetical protein [Frankiales bacterium]